MFMDAEQSLEIFGSILGEAAGSLGELSVEQGLDQVLAFYRQYRAEGCPEESDGDMLLYQWGPSGTNQFYVDLTRQFILGGCEDEDIWQLSLTFKFSLEKPLTGIKAGNQWCHKPRDREVDHFESFIRQSSAYRGVANLSPKDVDLDFHNIG